MPVLCRPSTGRRATSVPRGCPRRTARSKRPQREWCPRPRRARKHTARWFAAAACGPRSCMWSVTERGIERWRPALSAAGEKRGPHDVVGTGTTSAAVRSDGCCSRVCDGVLQRVDMVPPRSAGRWAGRRPGPEKYTTPDGWDPAPFEGQDMVRTRGRCKRAGVGVATRAVSPVERADLDLHIWPICSASVSRGRSAARAWAERGCSQQRGLAPSAGGGCHADNVAAPSVCGWSRSTATAAGRSRGLRAAGRRFGIEWCLPERKHIASLSRGRT